MPQPKNQKCENCQFWDRNVADDGFFGECFRHAPSPIIALQSLNYNDSLSEVYWPETTASDWCGEWKEAN